MPDTHDTGEKHPKSGFKRQPTAKKVLRARPVKSEIDHGALTREIIARFPKILAALAK